MLFTIGGFLTAEEVAKLRGLMATARFVDGKSTACGTAAAVKQNQQMAEDDPAAAKAHEIILAAAKRSKPLQTLAFVVKMIPPTYSRYGPGMGYGSHIDLAVMSGGGRMVRADISMTIFLSEPDSYEGGELVIERMSVEEHFKLPAGHAVVYDTGATHRVTPVTAGERLVAVLWAQSAVRDDRMRHILFDLSQVMDAMGADRAGPEHQAQLVRAYNNLLRATADN